MEPKRARRPRANRTRTVPKNDYEPTFRFEDLDADRSTVPDWEKEKEEEP